MLAEMLSQGPYYLLTVDPPHQPYFCEAPLSMRGKSSSPWFSVPLLFLSYLFTSCTPYEMAPVLCYLAGVLLG